MTNESYIGIYIGSVEEYAYIKGVIYSRGYLKEPAFTPGNPIAWYLDYVLADEAV